MTVDYEKEGTSGRGGYRNRGRGNRGKFRGRIGRGGKGDTGRHDSKVEKRRTAAPDECRFCYKKGHFQRDCWSFKRAQEQMGISQKGKSKDTKQDARAYETANVAIVDELSQGSDDLYLMSQYAMLSAPSNEWILDSGASTHFTGIQSDFTQLKRWANTKKVQLADGSIMHATGYRTLYLGGLLLKDVWLVPDFKTT